MLHHAETGESNTQGRLKAEEEAKREKITLDVVDVTASFLALSR